MWSSFSNNNLDSLPLMKPNSILKRRGVTISLIDPMEIYKNCINSLDPFLAAASAILTGTDTAALLSCDTKPYFSSLGYKFVKVYMSLTISKLFFQVSKFLCGLLFLIPHFLPLTKN